MADRILTWYTATWNPGAAQTGPAYFLEAAYEPVAVRVHAGVAPRTEDLKFDIFADGASILADHTSKQYVLATGIEIPTTPDTTASLSAGESSDAMAENFSTDLIEAGTWVTCRVSCNGEAQDITVQLELDEALEPMAGDEDE